MAISKQDLELFKTKAGVASAVVSEVESMEQALDYVVDLCGKKEICKLMVSGCDEAVSDKSKALCETKRHKIICAPALNKKEFSSLGKRCKDNGFELIETGMRDHLAGIDIAFTVVDHGICETGTLVLDSAAEEVRLATMIAETHVAVLPKSKMVKDSYDLEKAMTTRMSNPPSYMAFITGASRTADIERVLALGVHGPLELHILILEDK